MTEKQEVKQQMIFRHILKEFITKSRGWKNKERTAFRVFHTLGFVFTFYVMIMHGYIGFVHNASGEYCAYVENGEAYHIVINGLPCLITGQMPMELAIIFIVMTAVIQGGIVIIRLLWRFASRRLL